LTEIQKGIVEHVQEIEQLLQEVQEGQGLREVPEGQTLTRSLLGRKTRLIR
jgi:hypothetical protein